MDQIWSKGKGSPPLKGCRTTQVKLHKINVICPNNVVWGSWWPLKNFESSWEWKTWGWRRSWNMQPWWRQLTSRGLGRLDQETSQNDVKNLMEVWKIEDPWQYISLGDVSTCMQDDWYLQEDVTRRRPSPKGNIWFVFWCLASWKSLGMRAGSRKGYF